MQPDKANTADVLRASPQIGHWIGKWEFVESCPVIDNQGMEAVQYELTIKRENSKLVADLDINGYMTLRRIHTSCTSDGSDINIVFFESRQGDQNLSHFVKGDVLFRIE